MAVGLNSRAPGEVTRRSFLVGGTLALGASIVACSDAGSLGSPSAGSSIDEFSAVLRGSGADEGLDPGTSHLFIDEARLKALYDGLFEVDDSMLPVPRLAESGEPNGDGTRWRIRLRDARWHDGTKFTASDVLYTLARILGPASSRPMIAAATLSPIDLSQCRAIDPSTVEIVCRQPYFELLTALSAYGTKIVKDGTRDFARPVGTGPFRFESFEPGKQLIAAAYPEYWDGTPHVERLKILSADADARASAVHSGQADFADDLTPSAAKRLRVAEGVSVATTPHSGIDYFAMKSDRAPFNDPDVRRALMRMIDRRELVRVALEGQAEPGNDVFGLGYQYYAADLPPHTYDPDQARALLRRAGAERLSVDLFTAQVGTGFVEAARLFADQARNSGVNVSVRVGSKDTYYSDSLTTGQLTMGQSGPLSVVNHFASRLLTGAPQNRSNWSDPEFDSLFHQALRTASESGRAAIYRQMHEILYDRGGLAYWASAFWNSAWRSKFRNVPTGVPNSTNWARFNKVSL